MPYKPKIYFDNCVISRLLGINNPEYANTEICLKESERDAIKRLWELFKEKKILITTSAETRRELERHTEKYKDQEIKRLEYYSETLKIPVTSGGKYGQYKHGEGKYGVSPNMENVAQIIQDHEGKDMDVKHLVNFIDDSTCQYFVTLDRHLLCAKKVFFQKFSARIECPSITLKEIVA